MAIEMIGDVAVRSWPGAGQRTPVVLVHGLSGTSWDWNRTVMRLQGMPGPVAALDLPGFGASGWRDAGDYTVAGWSSAVRTVVRELFRDRDFAFVGHSLGGKIGIHVAAEEPRLGRLLLVDSGPTLGRGNFREHRFGSIPEAVEAYRSLYAGESDDVFLLRMAQYLEPDGEGSGIRIRRDPRVAESLKALDIEAERAELWTRWSQISVSVAVLRAERSHILDDDVQAKMLAENGSAVARLVPNASHNVLSDAPEVLAEELAQLWGGAGE